LIEHVLATIRRHNMLAPGVRAGVAVSGGADSVCLLHVLRALAPSQGWSLEVLHFDHSLRGPESDADADFVRGLARGAGLPFHIEKADAAALARASGGNLEQAARDARRAFYRRVMQSARLARAATGHTLSDQAETVMHRIVRGAGLQGLGGILPVTAEGLVRPLLECGREQVRVWLRSQGHPWREDSSNARLELSRNRIRHQVLPPLAAHLNPRVEAALARLARLAREDHQALDHFARQALSQCGVLGGGAWIIDLRPFQTFPPALQSRILRLAIHDTTGGTRRLELAHLDALLALCAAARGSGAVSLPGGEAERSFHILRIGPPAPSWPFPELALEPPFAAGPLRVEPVDPATPDDFTPPGADPSGPACSLLDAAALPGPLVLRNWRPGDAYQPGTHGEVRRIKFLFQSARAPAWDRRNWPVLLSGGRIAWARRFGPAAWARPTRPGGALLRVLDLDPPAPAPPRP
jgi:tRNA(Ile)-lysidine synthase